MPEKQVISKERVTNHGEVFTSGREVSAMLDLVKNETERIESRFLEPACGTGNFLLEILNRKLNVVANRYSNSQIEFERYSFLAISSVYGLEILKDSVISCRSRLYNAFENAFTSIFKDNASEDLHNAINFVLRKNIIWGDALTLKTLGRNPQSLIFSEWSPVNGGMIKRRDFAFKELLEQSSMQELPLFSDLGDDAFIPTPINEFPLVNFLRVGDDEQS